MNKDELNKITDYIGRAIDFLFVYNPTNTAIGLIFGVCMMGMRDLFAEYIPDISKIHKYTYLCIGIFIFNLPKIIFGKKISPEVEKKMKELEIIQKKGDFSEEEKRRQWRLLVLNLIDDGHIPSADTGEIIKV